MLDGEKKDDGAAYNRLVSISCVAKAGGAKMDRYAAFFPTGVRNGLPTFKRPVWLMVFAFLAMAMPEGAQADCDVLASGIIANQLRPAIENLDCSVLNQAGIDKKGHSLKSVCYESSGPTSRVNINAHLNCHSSDESVAAHLFGSKNSPSVSEDVNVKAEIEGATCSVNSISVNPSGELGKLLARMFDAEGQARKALQQGLDQICRPH